MNEHTRQKTHTNVMHVLRFEAVAAMITKIVSSRIWRSVVPKKFIAISVDPASY